MAAAERHIVLVESCDGFTDLTAVDERERESAEWLGLPIDELAGRLACHVTAIAWDAWRECAAHPRSWLGWSYPATRPTSLPAPPRRGGGSGRLVRRQLPALDPFTQKPLVDGPSAAASGLLNDSDPLFLASYCLNLELAALHQRQPIALVILPVWGGLGYMLQMTRATRAAPMVDVPVAVVATDTSMRRQAANDEGVWTRPALTRRQMEDMSLALADAVLTFGPRGERTATAGRLPDTHLPVRVPRRVDDEMIASLARAAETVADTTAVQLFVQEPQDGASGTLAALDAARLLAARGVALDAPIVACGPDQYFAPMQPRSFSDYWASRGFAKDLVRDGRWAWRGERPSGPAHLVRLYPSAFEHLPAVWKELASGSSVLLSPAAADGLVPDGAVPPDALIAEPCAASDVADAVQRRLAMPAADRDASRRQLCRAVVDAHRSPSRAASIDACARTLEAMIVAPPAPQDLARVAMLLTDRRQPLAALAPPASETRHPSAPTLSVIVTCYELGATLPETLDSIWASTRPPDEVILVDDGSREPETLAAIERALTDAGRRGRPLRLIRHANMGLAGARNAGLAQATGDLVSFLDGDDLVDPAYFAQTTALMTRYPALGGVGCWAHMFGDGVPDMYWNAPQPELPLLLVENTVVVPCVMWTSAVRELGGYDAAQRYNYEDWELSVRLLASGRPIVTIPAYLHRYRVRAGSLLRSMTAAQHQVMRERMFARHAGTVARFAVEIAMQLEQARGRALYTVGAPDESLLNRSLSRARRAVAQRVASLRAR